MTEAPHRRKNSAVIEPIRKSAAATKLEANLQDLKRAQDLESIRPFIIENRCFPATANVQTANITIDELKKLSRAWKLNERRNFWKTHTTVEDFVSVLRKHISDTIRPFNSAEAERLEREQIEKIKYKEYLSQPQKFTPTFRARSGMVVFYCGHKAAEVVRNPRDILTRSRYFQFPGLENSLGTMIGDMRMEDFERGNELFDEPSQDETESAVSVELISNDQAQRQKILTQRSLSVHLLAFSTSNTLPIGDRLAGYKAVQTFLEVGSSSDLDTINNSAMAIANLCANKFMRNLLIDQNCIHRYSAFLPFLNSPQAMMSCSLFFYYLSMEPEIEDRICSAGFKMLQKSIGGESLTLRMVSIQCLSNLLPCAERTRCVDLIVNSMHSMYRDFGEKIWNEELFTILANVSRITMNHTAMVEADFMDLISLAVAEMSKDDVVTFRLATEVLSSFLVSPDLADDLISSDYSRVFIDLLGVEDPSISAMCMRAFAVMSASEAFISCVCESDVVQVVCSHVSAPFEIEVVEDIAFFLFNVCSPTLKKATARVQDGAAHSMLELMTLYPTNEKIMYYSILGLRDLLINEETCVLLFADVVPELLKLVKASVGNIDIHILECLVNISIPVECDKQLVDYRMDVEILDTFVQGLHTESVPVQAALVKILVVLTRIDVIVERLLCHNILTALKDLVEFTLKQKQKDVWTDVARMMLAIINHQPEMTASQQMEVVGILHHLGSAEDSSEQMISDCAIVLAYLSYSIPDFSTVDPIIRSILKISESDTVMAAASTVLYNVACNDKDAEMLLKDNLHINIMIRMMRNGNAKVQRNVAEAMRLLCIRPKCNELLLQRELLSDFIVIALLRTNKTDVKKICGEAFFNMLCHASTRKKLLQGDLWWAMMRLSKTDVGEVRMVCAHTVFNLAMDPDNIDALRKNYVINFIKELCSEEGNQYLKIFLAVLDKIIEHSGENTPLNSLETTSIIQVLISSLLKVTDVDDCRWIGYLLSKVALLAIEGSEVNEFVNMDIVDVLAKTVSTWSVDIESRQHFSSVLCIVTSHNAFTLAAPFSDVIYILDFLVMHVIYDSEGNQEHCPLDSIICENIAQVLMNYVSRDQAEAKELINVSFFESLMVFGLTGKSYHDTADQDEKGQENEEDAQSSSVEKQDDDIHAELSNLMVIFVQLTAFVMPELMKFKKISRIRGEKAVSLKKMGKVDKVVTTLAALPVHVYLNVNLILDQRTRANTMRVIYGLCCDKTFAKEFVDLGLMSFMHTLMQSNELTRNGIVVNFCSLMCRNVSTHEKVATALVTSPKSLELLNVLVSLTSEKLRNDTFRRMSMYRMDTDTTSIQIGALFSDVCALLYNCSINPLPEDDFLTADGALSVISEITAVTENKDLGHLAKITIGRILDNSEGGGGFDPSYIAAILSEINDINALDQDRIDELVLIHDLRNCEIELEPIFSACTVEKEKDESVCADDLWTPIIFKERKRMELAKIEIESEGKKVPGKAENLKYAPVQPFPIEAYAKIFTTYPLQSTPSTIEADKERGDAGGSLNLVENSNFDNSTFSNSQMVDGSSQLSGFNSVDQDGNQLPSREDGTVSTASSTGRHSSAGKTPAPPSGGRSSSSSRDSKINRTQRQVKARNTVSKGDYKFKGV
mmetsp:Transcript_19566/g.32926  ORF Transcript_19566/g.32926 Transcript_19566/m.32926 type:complete len:1643 (+) Transcript_19566:93-5021(+)